MAGEDIVGTWFPSGYFGHFRSKTRNDILQEYRHAAAPSPPDKFVRRVRLCPDRHCFSKHDNRHSFPTDASYFDTGLGRRKSGRASTIFKPDFIAWIPHEKELKDEGAAMSVYRLDFRHGDSSPEHLPQRLSPRVRRRMAFQDEQFEKQKWLSDYKMYLQHGQPNPNIDTDFNTGRKHDGAEKNTRSYHDVNATGKLRKVIPHYLAHTESVKRRIKSAPLMHLSVGDCLSWPTQQLNESIVIPNRYDKRSESYKFRNVFAPKVGKKWRDAKPPTKEELLKPMPYHWREKVHLRPPAAEKRESEIKSKKDTRATSATTTASTATQMKTAYNGDVTPRPPPTPRESIASTMPTKSTAATPRPLETPNGEVTYKVAPYQPGSMTPAATPVTCFAPPAGPPMWTTQRSIPTVVVN